MVKTFNIVYSTTGWIQTPAWKKKLAAMPQKQREKFIRKRNNNAQCSDMTLPYFREQLIREAQRQGFKVVRWPFRGKDAWLKIGEAVQSGQMVPGSAAVLCHAWSAEKYSHECVPAWDFYPVLNAVMAKSDMIYPHPQLDQLHSEKRYSSKMMAPTRFIHFVRQPSGWKVRGQGDKDVAQVIKQELKKLKFQASAKGLRFEDLMVKKGLSWGGYAVKRCVPGDVEEFITEKILPGLPKSAQKITVLLQAKLDIVSELRWCMVDGELRGKEWKSLKEPKRGQLAVNAGYQNEDKARKDVDEFCKEYGKYSIDELESRIGQLCKRVYSEAVSDAGGEKPLYMRVDFLLDKQGRVWLGERESWGADLNGNDLYEKMDPTYKELTEKMINRTKCRLMGKLRNTRKVRSKFSSSTSPKRRHVEAPLSPTSSKRRCIESSPTSSKRACIAGA